MAPNKNWSVSDPLSYGKVAQDHTYESDSGVVVCPVAGRTPAYRVIRLHGGIGFRRVQWDYNRRGKPPIIPNPVDTPNDHILNHTVVVSMGVENAQAGGYDWSVRGDYVYVQLSPRTPGVDCLPTGGVPYPVAPNDGIAQNMGGPFLSTLGDDPNEFIKKIGETYVDHTDETYLWPFTALPPVFTNDFLIQG